MAINTAKEPAITVIIPIYNAAEHLSACLSSLQRQSLTSLEIICVDDASTDGTPNILRQFAASEHRARLIRHTSNKGEGASRNTGIESASGGYLFHLDPDDTLPENALERLYMLAQRNSSDIVKGVFEKVFPDGSRELQTRCVPPVEIGKTNIHESALLQQLPPSHCACLYRRQFVQEYRLRYPEDLTIGPDLVALAEAYTCAQTVTLTPDIVYEYHQSGNSVTRGSLPLRAPMDAIAARKRALVILRKNGFNSAANDRMKRWGFDINTYWRRMQESLPRADCKTVFEAVRELLEEQGVIPWSSKTGHHQRYLLALIMAGEDDRALDFLVGDDIREGFSSPRALTESLQFVLQVVPDDVGALFRLGMLTLREGDKTTALDMFDSVLKQDPGHAQARSQWNKLSAAIR